MTLATIDADAVADEIDVTDEMVAAYYDANPTLFQLPESADVEYIEIQRSDVAQTMAISEDELLSTTRSTRTAICRTSSARRATS